LARAGFALALAAVTGLLFGVLPASLIGRMQPSGDLRAAALVRIPPVRDTPADGSRRDAGCIHADAAGGSVTMGRTFLQLLGARLDFSRAAVSLSVALTGTPHEDGKVRAQYYATCWTACARSRVWCPPARWSICRSPRICISRLGRFEPAARTSSQQGTINTATPGYLAALGIPLLRGRDFTPQDRMAAIVTDGFAKRFGGAAALVGRRMFSPFDAKALTVVGVIPETSYRPGGGGPPEYSYRRPCVLPVNLTFVVRVRGNVDAYLPVCRDAIRAVDPQVACLRCEDDGSNGSNESLSCRTLLHHRSVVLRLLRAPAGDHRDLRCRHGFDRPAHT